ncbi:MAG: nucleotide exchange factor GrpE [Gammaproteobacteria bacterium]|nr:MAG: nucleotide exchange factor GrpE [Gammaproteobacteria bacterium]
MTEQEKEQDNVTPRQEQAAGGAPADESVDLQAALDDALAEAERIREEMLRARADLENMRRRTEREVASAHKYAIESFVRELLPVKDSLEMGLQAAEGGGDVECLREGVELTLKMLSDVLAKHGVVEVDPLGEKFSPELHQAMSMQETSEHEPGTVISVMQKGYTLNDRLVRPATVVVAKRPEGAEA